jgi:hypothetical protein
VLSLIHQKGEIERTFIVPIYFGDNTSTNQQSVAFVLFEFAGKSSKFFLSSSTALGTGTTARAGFPWAESGPTVLQ